MNILVVIGPAWVLGRIIARQPRSAPEQEPRGLAWKAFALGCSLVFAPAIVLMALVRPSIVTVPMGVFASIGAFGVLGFAFGRQWGSPRFWLNFAVCFSSLVAVGIGFPLARLLAILIRIRVPHGRAEMPILLTVLVLLPLMCWALLRYGGLFVPKGRRGHSLAEIFR